MSDTDYLNEAGRRLAQRHHRDRRPKANRLTDKELDEVSKSMENFEKSMELPKLLMDEIRHLKADIEQSAEDEFYNSLHGAN